MHAHTYGVRVYEVYGDAMSDVGLSHAPSSRSPVFLTHLDSHCTYSVSHHLRGNHHWPRHCVRGSAAFLPSCLLPLSESQQTSRLPANQRCSEGGPASAASLEEHMPLMKTWRQAHFRKRTFTRLTTNHVPRRGPPYSMYIRTYILGKKHRRWVGGILGASKLPVAAQRAAAVAS